MTTAPVPPPQAVLKIASGARQAKVLIAANELEVFTALGDGPLSADALRERTGLHPYGASHFLDALVGLELLERRPGGYANAPAADRYLVRGRPEYIGGFLRFLDRVLHPAWDGLADSLRTGRPANTDPYGGLYRDEADRDEFLAAMDTFNAPLGEALAARDWSQWSSVVDVGGARGNLAARLVRAHPHLRAGVFDLPEVRPAFDRHIAGLGHAPVEFTAGDFFADPLPEADVLLFGHVLHNWPPDKRVQLLRSAFKALRPGGAVLIYDALVEAAEPRLPNLLASLNMLVWSAGGLGYSLDDARAWLAEAGFGPAAAEELGPATTLVIAHKPR
ncbi:methyltransferase [Actinomadura gamaensis]|uniref:Methyltransferase n=1 Tax=Actinomadura gamaensis TaxID=1763541 RepID=A0ABV9TW69_9ACTN